MRRLAKLLLWGVFAVFASTAAQAKEDASLYLALEQLDSTLFIAPPPGPDVARREIEWMLDLQGKRTPEQAARSAADLEQSVFRFADVMGPKFAASNLPIATKFFKKLYKTESAFNKQGKDKWDRPRPPVVDKRLEPVAKYGSSGSYPSGHSAFGFLTGIALAGMVPEKHAQIFERAREFGDNRVLGGVHYPSDIEAGRQLAVMIAVLAQQNPQYREDFTAARAEVRSVLGLP